jgi:hypothetical protein
MRWVSPSSLKQQTKKSKHTHTHKEKNQNTPAAIELAGSYLFPAPGPRWLTQGLPPLRAINLAMSSWAHVAQMATADGNAHEWVSSCCVAREAGKATLPAAVSRFLPAEDEELDLSGAGRATATGWPEDVKLAERLAASGGAGAEEKGAGEEADEDMDAAASERATARRGDDVGRGRRLLLLLLLLALELSLCEAGEALAPAVLLLLSATAGASSGPLGRCLFKARGSGSTDPASGREELALARGREALTIEAGLDAAAAAAALSRPCLRSPSCADRSCFSRSCSSRASLISASERTYASGLGAGFAGAGGGDLITAGSIARVGVGFKGSGVCARAAEGEGCVLEAAGVLEGVARGLGEGAGPASHAIASCFSSASERTYTMRVGAMSAISPPRCAQPATSGRTGVVGFAESQALGSVARGGPALPAAKGAEAGGGSDDEAVGAAVERGAGFMGVPVLCGSFSALGRAIEAGLDAAAAALSRPCLRSPSCADRSCFSRSCSSRASLISASVRIRRCPCPCNCGFGVGVGVGVGVRDVVTECSILFATPWAGGAGGGAWSERVRTQSSTLVSARVAKGTASARER